ncbi:breast cancer metastasis-suppressor 1-like protein-A isoform X2 [Bacillus rossius redtenbacheri]
MLVIKHDHDDSDGEEMDRDSPESDKSTSSCDSSEPPSDSDDSSEMDEEECDRRRTECLENLMDLERQFTLLREQLYRERVQQVDSKLEEVRGGGAQEYLQPLRQLEQSMQEQKEVAGCLRGLKLENLRNMYEAEEQAAFQNFESDKALLWDSLHGELQEKIRRLEEDRHSVDLETDLWLVERRPQRRGKAADGGRRKPVSVAGPYLVYMLSDEDILEDWTAIKKALSVSKRKTDREWHSFVL